MTPGSDPRIDSSISMVEGDTWTGINPSVSIIDVDGSPPDNDLSSVIMQFKKRDRTTDVIDSLSSADGDIIIDSANGWQFHIPEQDRPKLKSGDYSWFIQCTDAAGNKFTYLSGYMKVLPKGVIP